MYVIYYTLSSTNVFPKSADKPYLTLSYSKLTSDPYIYIYIYIYIYADIVNVTREDNQF